MLQSRPCVFAFSLCLTRCLFAAEPRVLDDRLKLELFAEHPQIVTPTGIDVDHTGRVWAIESNTHFPPEGYQGHPSDRLLVLEDTDADGRADKVTVFADGLRHAMSVAVRPVWLDEPVVGKRGRDGEGERGGEEKKTPAARSTSDTPSPSRPPAPSSVFLATRREISLLRDTDGDNQCDERHRLVHLETKGDYPHNGLAGFAFDALGWMFFGFGENLGEPYQIIGSDGVTLSGGGEGGNIYRCRPDGTKLEKWATGFWNPHASCFDAFGRLFTVDNDPDSRPPCRLLHIIPGGDYGYRFRNGRKGTHPFTAWNGEIPGTLPMVSGTGEAPSGILCYESDGFPADYLGTLLVGSWGDHRIDKFVLEPKGASFVSRPQPIVQGDENFRPVGLALAPDGSVFFSDWVLRDYKLHGKGRVWRLSAKKAPNKRIDVLTLDPARKEDREELFHRVVGPHLVDRRLAARILSHHTITAGEAFKLTQDENPIISARGIYELQQFAFDRQSSLARHGNNLVFEVSREFDATLEGFPKGQQVVLEDVAEAMIDLIATGSDDELNEVASRVRKEWIWSTPGPQGFHDPFLVTGLVSELVKRPRLNQAISRLHSLPDDWKVSIALGCLKSDEIATQFVPAGLAQANLDVRRLAVQHIGEAKLSMFRRNVERLLEDSTTTPDLVLACLATLSLLDGVPASEFEKTPPAQYALAMVVDEQRPAALRATALRLMPPSMPELKGDLLAKLAQSPDRALQTEAVRTLQQSPRAEALPVLLKLANDANVDVDIRADAVSALCAIVPHEKPLPAEVETLLLSLADGRLRFRDSNEQQVLQFEAIRALRGRAVEGSTIGRALRAGREAASDDRALREALDLALTGKSDPQLSTLKSQPPSDSQPSTLNSQPDAGRRVFFAHQGPLCSKCHTVHGRGGKVGPDLSVIARTMSREKLIDSILDPSKEISPYFLTWAISTTSGKVHTGLIVTENGGGDIDLGDADGNVIKIPRKDVEERTPSKVSVMPQGLHQRMTTQEFADLLAYLETLK